MTSGVGFFGASHLLLKLHTNCASEDDLRRIAECEARLMLAGFGNHHDLRKPGEITKNLVLGIGVKLNNVDGSQGKRIFCDFDEQLRLVGFDDPLDAENIKDIINILSTYVSRYSGTTNKVPDETPRNTNEPRQPESASRVGILTAVDLLYELEMGIINDYELRQLAEYEKRLKTGKEVRPEVSSEVPRKTTIVTVENNQWPPPTIGIRTNNILTDLSTKLAGTKDAEAKALKLKEFEKQLRHAGFGNHYGARKIEELMNELEDLRRARGNTFNEETGEDGGKDRKELLPEVSVKVTPEVSEVAIKMFKIQKKIEKLEKQLKLAGFGENCSTVKIQELKKELETLKMTQGTSTDTSKTVEVPLKVPSVITETYTKAADTLKEVQLNTTVKEIKSDVKRQKPVLGPGFVTASYLLCQLELGDAIEDDRRKLVQYEERLKSAGFGSDIKTESASTLGKITNAFIKQYKTKLAETSNIEARNLISDEYEEHLKQAGFYEHYSAAQFKEIWTGMAKDLIKAKYNDSSDRVEALKVVSTEVLNKNNPVVSAEVSNQVEDENAEVEISNDVAHDNYSSKEVEDEKSTGVTENNARESANENAGMVAVEIQNKITAVKVEEVAETAGLCAENGNAAECTRDDPNKPAEKHCLFILNLLAETARQCQSRNTEDPKDLRDEQTSIFGAANLEQVSKNLPKTGLSAAFHIVFKVQMGQASEDEIKKLSECEEKLIMSAEMKSDNVQATASETLPALGTITLNLLREFSTELKMVPAGDREAIHQICTTYVNKLKFAGFDTIPETEEIWNQLEYAFSCMYKATVASEAVSNEEVQSDAESSKVSTAETLKNVPDKDVSEVSDKVVKEKKEESIGNKQGDVALVENQNMMLEKETNKMIDKKETVELACNKADVAAEKNTAVVAVAQKAQAVVGTKADCKQGKNATDKARESTSEAADKTYSLVKLDSPSPPIRVSKTEDTTPKNPQHVPMNIKPERKIVVARRRLKERAPIDWFSTDGSKPPPGFDKLYTSLYSELPLSCRAYAFSTRLKGIKDQLKNANEPLACLLRKEFSNVKEAFDKYLNTYQTRVSMEPTHSSWSRVQPNREKWRLEIISQLFMSLDNLPGGLRIRPLDFSQPLTIRASLVAERLKMVEVKLGKADARQALHLCKEFGDIVASFATRWGRPLDCPIPGEPYDDRTSRPLPDELERLRQDKNRAEKEYKWFSSAANKQVRDQLTNEFKRQLANWKQSQV